MYKRQADGQMILFNKVRHHFLGFSRSGTVADDNDIDLVFVRQLFQHLLGSRHIIFGLSRVNGGIGEKLSGFIDDRHFASGPVPRVDTDNCLLYTSRCV